MSETFMMHLLIQTGVTIKTHLQTILTVTLDINHQTEGWTDGRTDRQTGYKQFVVNGETFESYKNVQMRQKSFKVIMCINKLQMRDDHYQQMKIVCSLYREAELHGSFLLYIFYSILVLQLYHIRLSVNETA